MSVCLDVVANGKACAYIGLFVRIMCVLNRAQSCSTEYMHNPAVCMYVGTRNQELNGNKVGEEGMRRERETGRPFLE